MDAVIQRVENVWGLSSLKSGPVSYFGRAMLIVLRILFGLFFLLAGINKLRKDWLFSDILKEIFLQRLTELNPSSFPSLYLEYFALPLYPAVAWVVTFGELAAGIGLLFGIATRWSAILAFFILFNFAIGGYYDASLLPFFILVAVFIYFPTGRWLGFDPALSRKFGRSFLFR